MNRRHSIRALGVNRSRPVEAIASYCPCKPNGGDGTQAFIDYFERMAAE
jgi:hypothetical protein